MTPMRRRGRRLWILPLALVAAVLIGLPVAAMSESGPERRLKESLGLVREGCVAKATDVPGWRPERPLPDRRDEPRAVAAGGQVYLAGGISRLVDYGEPGTVPGVRERVEVRSIDRLTRFDPSSGRYVELAPMPEPLNHIGLVSQGADILLVGGHGNLLEGADPKRSLHRYRPALDRWEPLPPMPTARGASAVGLVGGRLLVAGGQSRGSELSTLEIFDFRTRRWSRGPDLPTAREHAAGAVLDGRFYVLGGRNRRTDALAAVERYDPERRNWEELDPLPVASGGLEGVAAENAVFALGGGNDRAGTVTGAVQRYDPRSATWSEVGRMRTPRHGFAAAELDGRVWTFGGSPCALFAATDVAESFAPRGAR